MGEIALSFIEFIQFKQCLLKDFNTNTNTIESNDELLAYDNKFIELSYLTLPKSTIVYKNRPGMNQYDRHRAIAHELYEKYLKIGSEYELNINHCPRIKYRELDDNNWQINNYELIKVFNSTIITQRKYMAISFGNYEWNIKSKAAKAAKLAAKK